MMRTKQQRNGEKGSFTIEFALGSSLLVMMSAYVGAFGVNLNATIEASNLAAYTSNIYSRGVDLTVPAVAARIKESNPALDRWFLTQRGANIFLSTVIIAAAGANEGLPVITHRVRIGRGSVWSEVAMPPIIDSEGHVSEYENSTYARVTLPAGAVVPQDGTLYISEVVFNSRGWDFPGIVGDEEVRVFGYR